MTIRKLPAGGAWMPLPVNIQASTGTTNNDLLLDESLTSRIAFTFFAPVSGTLETFEFFMGGTFDPDTTLLVSFQSLDSDDLPDASYDAFRVIRLGDYGGTWINPGLITSDGTDTGAKRTVTRGERLACVIEFDSGTFGDLITFPSLAINDDTARRSVGGALVYDSSWHRHKVVGCAALKYQEFPSTAGALAGQEYVYMPELLPLNTIAGTPLNTGTTPDEVGLEFAFPAPVRVGGASFCLSTTVDGVEFDCVLYDQASNVLDTVPMKMHTDLFPANGYSYWTARFSQDFFVPANEQYKVTVKPSSASSVKLLELSFADSVILSDVFGYRDTGNNEHLWIHVERTNGGEWTQSTLLPLISLNITGVDMQTGGATDDWEGDA